MSKQRINRGLSLLLALWLLASWTAPLAQAAGTGDVHIASPEDLLEFSRNCALDTWSQGKTVLLDADLDLSGADYEPIPTFGGVFQGQGHTISGLHITKAGSAVGLFRYIQPGAVVQDLTVRGTVAPEGTRCTVGGIAGDNAGTLQNCAFAGVVRGETAVGGIAGRSAAGGEITGCSATGTVSGEKATGGIVGRNSGLLLKCVNNAGVNLTQAESGLSAEEAGEALEELTADGRDQSWLLDGCTDTGGIAGWTSGVVQSCVNNGGVGYPHVGYNTGGIAGRQNGYLADCVNNGTVHGRKDVGGIVGQAEPYLLVDPGRDTLEELDRELDKLDQLTGSALDGAQRTGDNISAHLTALGDYAGGARDSSKRLLDRVSGFTDETVSTVNTLTAQLTGALDRLTPALDDLSDTGGRLEQLAGELDGALGHLGGAADTGGLTLDGLRDGVESLRHGRDQLDAAVNGMRQAARTLAGLLTGFPSIPSRDQLRQIREEIRRAFTALRTAKGDLSGALDGIQDGLDQSGPLAGQLGDALDHFRQAADSAATVGRLLDQAFDTVQKAVEDLTREGPTEFTPLGDAAREASDSLYNALAGLSGEMEALNSAIQSGGDSLSADLRAVSRQFNVVSDVLLRAVSDFRDGVDAGPDDVIQDTSDEDIAATREGKVDNCRNTGTVEGDRNVGGVVGAMAVEVDIDPEDDISDRLSFGATYETKAVLQGCVNQGGVTAKKDCAGGAVGRMDLGTALDCQSYGPVASTGGDYVGGVAGYARGSVRSCYGKNVLSGGSYVGGIAGWASRLRDCCAIATIAEGTEYLGAVAGCVETGGVLSGNRFVDTGWAGVDGVSYAGRAEPAAFEALAEMDGVPAEFTAFTLTLLADGEMVAQTPFFYGDDLSKIQLPDPPEKEDCYGVWPEFDQSGNRSDLTVEAVYVPWVTLLASGETEGKLSLALAEGRFTEDAVLRASDSGQAPPSGCGEDARVLEISLTGAEPGDPVPLRLLNPEGGKAVIWQYQDGQWKTAEAVQNGRYWMLAMEGTSGIFCVQPQGSALAPALGLAAAGLLLALLAAAAILRRRKRKAAKAPETQAETPDVPETKKP